MIDSKILLETQLPQKQLNKIKINKIIPPQVSPVQGNQGNQVGHVAEVKKTHLENAVHKFSFATKGGSSVNNPYKQNQDSFITNPHMLRLPHCHLFAVCDGHGINGHKVSNFLK